MALGSTITQVTESGIKPGITWPSFVSSGVATATNFKTGTTDVHSTGVTAATVVVGSAVTGNSTGLDITGIVTATSFSGSGANLTSIPAGQLTGTVADARISTLTSSKLSGALPAIDGSALTGINTAFGSGTSINTTGIITATAFIPSTGQLSHRNLIINGSMTVAQRATSASGSFTTADVAVCDRWEFAANATDQLSMDISQEAMNSVNGFGKYLKMSPGTAESGGAADEYVSMRYKIEAQDCQQLEWGLSSAKSATLSFWVKSNVTGAACVNITKEDATKYQITRTYTINVANTWEYKTLTIPGLTASGIPNDNGAGIIIHWFLDAGSNYKSSDSTSWGTFANGGYAYGHSANFIDSTSTNWNITGVQFELGSVATPFEHKFHAEEFKLCQRYYQRGAFAGACLVGTPHNYYFSRFAVNLPTSLRANPAVTISPTPGGNNYLTYATWSSESYVTGNVASSSAEKWVSNNNFNEYDAFWLNMTVSSGTSLPANGPGANNMYPTRFSNVIFDAEL